jgi:glycosyltransferase involved in cell wall biosynthesis
MAQEIQHRHGREAWIVRNPRAWPAKGMTSGGNLYEKGRRRGMLLYTGAICHINASTIRIVISALERIDMPSVLLHVYTAQAKEELQLLGMCGPKLVLHPHAPYEEVELVQRSADVLLVPFDFESPAAEAIRTAAPGELGDYLASGRPILAVVPTDTFVAWYLRRHDCGLVVDKADAEAVAEAVRRLLEDPDLESRLVANAAARAEEDFDPSWAQQAWLHALQLKQSRSCMSQPTAR